MLKKYWVTKVGDGKKLPAPPPADPGRMWAHASEGCARGTACTTRMGGDTAQVCVNVRVQMYLHAHTHMHECTCTQTINSACTKRVKVPKEGEARSRWSFPGRMHRDTSIRVCNPVGGRSACGPV